MSLSNTNVQLAGHSCSNQALDNVNVRSAVLEDSSERGCCAATCSLVVGARCFGHSFQEHVNKLRLDCIWGWSISDEVKICTHARWPSDRRVHLDSGYIKPETSSKAHEPRP